MSQKSPRIDSKAFEEKVRSFVSSLEIPFVKIDSYLQSFVHRSVLNERITNFSVSNERLEFLWDAVLELSVTEFLFEVYPEKPEGELTDIRSALVRGRNLAEVASDIGFHDYVLLSKGEALAGGSSNPYILANTFEAFLGAIYLDLGYSAAKNFVLRHVCVRLEPIMEQELYIDPKSSLQELTQEKYSVPPTYVTLEETGSDHEKLYQVGVFINERQIGEWFGTSKKKAQQQAAIAALESRNEWLDPNV